MLTVEFLDAGCLERVAPADQFAQLAQMRSGRRRLGSPPEQARVGRELVGLVAGEPAAAIRFDAGRMDDADLHALAVQEGCKVEAKGAGRFHAGVFGGIWISGLPG